jgi:hypothetical protein
MKTWSDIILNEIFNTKIPIRVSQDSNKQFVAWFEIPAEDQVRGSGDFSFQFYASRATEEDPWEVLFLRVQGGEFAVAKPGFGSIDVLGDMTTKETLATFSGVKTAMMKWVKSRKPDVFAFTAKSAETSRVKLYKKMAKLITKKINYKMISGTTKGAERFLFTRI